jgi:hypothetical protein
MTRVLRHLCMHNCIRMSRRAQADDEPDDAPPTTLPGPRLLANLSEMVYTVASSHTDRDRMTQYASVGPSWWVITAVVRYRSLHASHARPLELQEPFYGQDSNNPSDGATKGVVVQGEVLLVVAGLPQRGVDYGGWHVHGW